MLAHVRHNMYKHHQPSTSYGAPCRRTCPTRCCIRCLDESMGRLKPRCIIGRHRRRGIECRGDSEKNTPTEFLVGVEEYEEENKQVEEEDKKDQQQEQVDSPGVRYATVFSLQPFLWVHDDKCHCVLLLSCIDMRSSCVAHCGWLLKMMDSPHYMYTINYEYHHQQEHTCRLAVEILRFYKTGISPLLPPSCRFVPTCSVYATEAYTTYGVTKGTILTAWRLMRCNPWGGSGYDPVSWPPPGLPWLQH